MVARSSPVLALLVVLTASLAGLARPAAAAGAYTVRIDGQVDAASARLVRRALALARAADEGSVAVALDSRGGSLDAAADIADALASADVPTVAYVDGRADAAGALVALAARTIVMAPGATLGDAAPGGEDPGETALLRARFASLALRWHRDPALAAAMVDPAVRAPELKAAGDVLVLSAADARRAGYAAAIAPTLDAALAVAGVSGGERVVPYDARERLVRWAAGPVGSGVLLGLGILGLLVELVTLHGVAGIAGLAALALFFGAHAAAGEGGSTVLAVALASVACLAFALHVVPGHVGIGAVGVLGLAAAAVLAFGYGPVSLTAEALSIAIVQAAVCFAFAMRVLRRSGLLRSLELVAVQGPEYVAGEDRRALVGRFGFAVTYLRPAGYASIDGRRVDVLGEGEFVQAGAPIVVTRVEGSRVFVREDRP